MVTRADVGLMFGLAAFLTAGVAYFQHASLSKQVEVHENRLDSADEVAEHDDEMQGQFAERITALEKRGGGGEVEVPGLAEANQRISSLRKELTDAMNEVAEMRTQISGLAQRIQALEKPR